MAIIHRLTYAAAIILTTCYFPVHARTFGVPGSYTIPLDDALFVMLRGRCTKHSEVHDRLNEQEYQILRSQLDTTLAKRKSNLSRTRLLDPCAAYNANANLVLEGPIRYREGYLLHINRYKWTPKASMSNENGEVYPVSGIYRANNALMPDWSVDWYAIKVFPSRDGRYLVRLGYSEEIRDDLAVAFYDRGELLHAYSVDELIPNTNDNIRRLARYNWASDVYLDNEKGIFYAATPGNMVYEFDITTGQLTHGGAIEYPSYTAEVETLSGDQYILFDFMTNEELQSIDRPLLFQSESDNQQLIGRRVLEPDTTDGVSNSRLVYFSFSEITQITRDNTLNMDEVCWRIKTISGDEHVIKIGYSEESPYWFTGQKSSGETLDLLPKDIYKIVFR